MEWNFDKKYFFKSKNSEINKSWSVRYTTSLQNYKIKNKLQKKKLMPSNEVALSWWTFYVIFSYPSVTKDGRIRTFFLFKEVEPDMRAANPSNIKSILRGPTVLTTSISQFITLKMNDK